MAVLRDIKIVLLVGILLGLLFPQGGRFLYPLFIPGLIVLLTLSLKHVAVYHVKKSHFSTIAKLVIINLGFVTVCYIIAARYFTDVVVHRQGLLILAFMPPALTIVSLTYLLHGNVLESLLAEWFGYVVSLFLMPMMISTLDKEVSPVVLLWIIVLMLVAPLVLSRVIHHLERSFEQIRHKYSPEIVNVCWGFSTWVLVSLNHDMLIPGFILPLVVIFLVLKFGIGTLVFLVLKRTISRSEDVEYLLFATMKNEAAGVGIAVLAFGIPGTMPFAISAILAPFYIGYVEWLTHSRIIDSKDIR